MSSSDDRRPLLYEESEDVPNILSEEQEGSHAVAGDVPNILTERQNPPELGSDGDVLNILNQTSNNEDASSPQENERDGQSDGSGPSVSVARSGRSRRRRRHRSDRNRRLCRRRPISFPGLKGKETNLLAAVCSMLVIVATCTALVEPQWFSLYGGGCRDGSESPRLYLGVADFMRPGGYFLQGKGHHSGEPIVTYRYGNSDHEVLIECVTEDTVRVLYCVVSFCLGVIALSLVAFTLDLAGPQRKVLKELRRCGVFNLLAVVLCVLAAGFCYWASEQIYTLQDASKPWPSSRIDVQFSVSFYLLTTAGVLSVVAAACNLWRTNVYYFDPRDVYVNERNEQVDFGAGGFDSGPGAALYESGVLEPTVGAGSSSNGGAAVPPEPPVGDLNAYISAAAVASEMGGPPPAYSP